MTTPTSLRFALTLACTLFASMAQAEMPVFDDVRTVVPPPGANVAAAFFRVNNGGEQALSITAAASSVATTTELHLSSIVDDVARMQEQAEILIPAGESLEFRHGSYHVMLSGLHKELAVGDEYELTLTTSAGDVTLMVPVVERNMSGMHAKDDESH